MIKAVLMLKNEIILPTAGFESINPRIQGKEKLVVPAVPIPWPSDEPRRVMVTNFGKHRGRTVPVWQLSWK
jgi:acyl transferase domain-containing protein